MTEVVTNERLTELVRAKKTLIEVAYGCYPETGEPILIRGEEIDRIAHELLVLRQRNLRLAQAAIEGNRNEVFREFTRQSNRGY